MQHVMDFEGGKKRKDQVQPCAGIKNRVFWIGQKGLPVSISIRPESKIALFHELYTQMTGGYFQEGRIPFKENPCGEEKILEDKQKKHKKQQEKQQILPGKEPRCVH